MKHIYSLLTHFRLAPILCLGTTILLTGCADAPPDAATMARYPTLTQKLVASDWLLIGTNYDDTTLPRDYHVILSFSPDGNVSRTEEVVGYAQPGKTIGNGTGNGVFHSTLTTTAYWQPNSDGTFHIGEARTTVDDQRMPGGFVKLKESEINLGDFEKQWVAISKDDPQHALTNEQVQQLVVAWNQDGPPLMQAIAEDQAAAAADQAANAQETASNVLDILGAVAGAMPSGGSVGAVNTVRSSTTVASQTALRTATRTAVTQNIARSTTHLTGMHAAAALKTHAITPHTGVGAPHTTTAHTVAKHSTSSTKKPAPTPAAH